jgi:tetratricopeptide (TPR) repeat protein
MDDNEHGTTPEELLQAFSQTHSLMPEQQEDGSNPSCSGDAEPEATFDSDEFLKGLDAIFEAHEANEKAEPYLKQAMADAENAGDDAGLLTVLNETMGFYRSRGRHEDNQWIVQRALELGLKMGIEGSEAWTTTLINAATAMRAAKRYDQSEELYRQALDSAHKTLAPTDRRMAALHNNISMLYSENGNPGAARDELEQALSILQASSTDPETDIDVASTHTNLALVLLQCATESASVVKSSNNESPASVQNLQTATNRTNATSGKANSECSSSTDVDSLLDQAMQHSSKALEIYRNGHLEHSAHFASALAGYAQTCFAAGMFDQSVDAYRKALKVIKECYGVDSDYYRITAANLAQVEESMQEAGTNLTQVGPTKHKQNDAAIAPTMNRTAPVPGRPDGRPVSPATETKTGTSRNAFTSPSTKPNPVLPVSTSAPSVAGFKPHISGLKLAREYWQTYGKPMIAEKYPKYQGRIAAGLVGHGSECYGFDDQYSQDHDFGPGFCLWLTDEDYEAIGEQLQADYEALPQEFMGFGPRKATARAQGEARRTGVFRIGDFFASITGYPAAPADDKPHEWLLLDEPTLAAATNGEIFADPLGAVSKTRQGFKLMPEDVRLSLISRRLGMIAQAGQYNLPRMLKRSDGAGAWLSIREFVTNVCSLIFLINEPIRAGYMPYYKWQFAALRKLSTRMSTVLPDVCEQLETVLRLSSAACFGGAGFGEGGKGAAPAVEQIQGTVEHICTEIVTALQQQGLTDSSEQFLEWQRPYVEAHIGSDDPVLHSL